MDYDTINIAVLKGFFDWQQGYLADNSTASLVECTTKAVMEAIQKDIDIQVEHPTHYNSHPSGVECIEVASQMDYCLGNAIKYRWRRGLKDGQPTEKDDAKAAQYLKLRKQYLPDLDEMSIDDVDNLIEFEISEILKSRKDDDIPF